MGSINFCNIWHDNSGKTAGKSSWYLKHIIINDLQTKEKYYFICEKWLAIDCDDGLFNRVLPVAGDEQKKEIKYLLSKETKNKLANDHLWFSIVAKTTINSFTRTDRLTCCFLLLYMTMLVNILYYDIDKSPTPNNGINIGPVKVAPQQVWIFYPFNLNKFSIIYILILFKIFVGVISNLILFIPSFIIIQLFKRSRRRSDRSKYLKKALENYQKYESL